MILNLTPTAVTAELITLGITDVPAYLLLPLKQVWEGTEFLTKPQRESRVHVICGMATPATLPYPKYVLLPTGREHENILVYVVKELARLNIQALYKSNVGEYTGLMQLTAHGNKLSYAPFPSLVNIETSRG